MSDIENDLYESFNIDGFPETIQKKKISLSWCQLLIDVDARVWIFLIFLNFWFFSKLFFFFIRVLIFFKFRQIITFFEINWWSTCIDENAMSTFKNVDITCCRTDFSCKGFHFDDFDTNSLRTTKGKNGWIKCKMIMIADHAGSHGLCKVPEHAFNRWKKSIKHTFQVSRWTDISYF